jgi:hypothetical protein
VCLARPHKPLPACQSLQGRTPPREYRDVCPFQPVLWYAPMQVVGGVARNRAKLRIRILGHVGLVHTGHPAGEPIAQVGSFGIFADAVLFTWRPAEDHSLVAVRLRLSPGRPFVARQRAPVADPFDTFRLTHSGLARRLLDKLQFSRVRLMSRAAVRSLQWSVAMALLLGAGSPSAVAGQAPPNIGGVLGAILNSTLTEEARREWERRSIADYSCLEAHNLSVDRLVAEGIVPNDPGIQRVFAQCAREAASAAKVILTPIATTASASHNHDFVVDGLAVGAAVHPDSHIYKTYKCKSSDQFSASHGARLNIP